MSAILGGMGLTGLKKKVKLRSEPVRRTGGNRLSVDREGNGALRGISLISTGPALGHGFEIDETAVKQVSAFSDGIRGRWTHGGLSEDGLARHLGRHKKVGTESFSLCRPCGLDQGTPSKELSERGCIECGGDLETALRAVTDFEFSASARKIKPDGLDVDAVTYLLDRAEEDPGSFGQSIVAAFTMEAEELSEEEIESGKRPKLFGRLEEKHDLIRGDFVADPAANAAGLHAGTNSPSAMTEEAEIQFTRLASRVGPEEALARAHNYLKGLVDKLSAEDDVSVDTDQAPEADANETELNESTNEASLEAKLAELTAKVESQAALIKALRDVELDRQQRDRDIYVEQLAETAINKFGNPIPETDLQKIRDHLSEGRDEIAKELGEAYLRVAEAKAAPSGMGRANVSFELGKTPAGKKADRADAELTAECLRQAGKTVKITEDNEVVVVS